MDYFLLGLGNPGTEYEKTRHNVGFLCLGEFLSSYAAGTWRKPVFKPYLSASTRLFDKSLLLVKPLTFMNLSGNALSHLPSFDVSKLIVILDNMDLPCGQIRLKKGGSDAGHNGLKSIDRTIGSSEYYRLYIGIGRPADKDVISHVLGQIPQDDSIYSGIRFAAEALQVIIKNGPEKAMNEINRKKAV